MLTTHGDLKARFREAERALQVWEAARCATGGSELDDPPGGASSLRNFTTTFPQLDLGSLRGGPGRARGVRDNALQTAEKELGQDGAPALFNPLPVERIHVLEGGRKAVKLAPLAGASISELPVVEPTAPVRATKSALESPQVKAVFTRDGRIEFARVRRPRNRSARAARRDSCSSPITRTISRRGRSTGQTFSLGRPVDSPAEVSLLRGRELLAGVEFRRALSAKSRAAIRYSLDAFQPVLHVEYEIDWHEEMTLLKTLFPTAYTGRMARFGAPFGSVLRGQLAGPLRDEALFEGAASAGQSSADDGEAEGLGVVTEAKYGFSCRDGLLGVSLLRSPRVTGGDPNHARIFPPPLRRGTEALALQRPGPPSHPPRPLPADAADSARGRPRRCWPRPCSPRRSPIGVAP